MDYRIKRQLGAIVGGAVLALVIVLAARDAHADPAATQLIAAFDRVNNACLGAPLRADGKYAPACAARDRAARALERAGYERSRHDVWFRSADMRTLYALTRVATADARRPEDAPRGLRALVRLAGLSDVELLAIWQQHAPEFRDADPTAWAVASELMGQISASHPNDPRFMLD